MTERAEILLQRLGLAYRVLLMSTREMGFTQARKYDLEVWSPGVERWLEVSSCSNFRDFQARRMAIRYRPEPGAKPELVHTLNGSGPGARPRRRGHSSRPTSGRTARSSVPEVLRPYLGRDATIDLSERRTARPRHRPRDRRTASACQLAEVAELQRRATASGIESRVAGRAGATAQSRYIVDAVLIVAAIIVVDRAG